MKRPVVEGTLLDLGREGDAVRTSGPIVDVGEAMRVQLEPLIVELNLAGYEVTAILASAGPNGASPCHFDSIEAALLAPALGRWDDFVVGPTIDWGSAKAALALRIVPRLAMRRALTDQGSLLPSSYGIDIDIPGSWLGVLDKNAGGWIATVTANAIEVPAGFLGIAGATEGATPAAELLAAVRNANAAAWHANVPPHDSEQPDATTAWTAQTLGACGLAPLLDPRAWELTPGDEASAWFGEMLRTFVWRNETPPYSSLASYTLTELLRISIPTAAERYVEETRARFRAELMRRYIIDAGEIAASTFTDRSLGPRVLALFAEMEGFGTHPLPVDLFLLLELGLVSLRRRADDEEPLPTVIPREWTALNLTARYDEVVEPIEIGVDELGDRSTAGMVFDRVAAQSNAVAINQAGTHIEGFWQERVFRADNPGPVVFETYRISGDRASDDPLRFDVEFSAEDYSSSGSLAFNADGSELIVSSEGSQWTLRRMDEQSRLASRGNERLLPAHTRLITPHMNVAEIESFLPPLVELVRARERHWLSATELELLDAIVARICFDLEWVAAQGVQGELVGTYLCTRVTAAFSYFFDRSLAAPHVVLARQYIKQKLLAMPGNDAPLDPVLGSPPATYWHALAAGMGSVPCPAVNVGLQLPPTEIASLGQSHTYRWKFRTAAVSGLSGKVLEKFTKLDAVAARLLRGWLERGTYVLTKIDDVEFSIGPDPQVDFIEAEFQKISPYVNTSWPGSEVAPQSVLYVGILAGFGFSASLGMNISFESEWSVVDTQNVEWTPDDFAGWFAGVGLNFGWSLLGLEELAEASLRWLWSTANNRDFRTAGEHSYIQFISPDKEDVWALLFYSFTDTLGAHIGIGVSATGGYLWRVTGDDNAANDRDLALVLDPVRWSQAATSSDARVSFEVGRSELTEAGAELLHEVAASYLYELAGPSSSIEIVGHTSPDDARALYNQTLSERRAANVLRYLKAYLGPMFGIVPMRMVLRGVGQSESEQHPDDDPASWRRVDVKINGRLALRMVAL
jgi:outer membrane protein OmpA-like peptidoglycan-associated protein